MTLKFISGNDKKFNIDFMNLTKAEVLNEAEELFIKLVNDYNRIKINPNGIEYINKYGEWAIAINMEIKTVWFQCRRFWSLFLPYFDNNPQEFKTFMVGMVEKYLNCMGFTNLYASSTNYI